MRAFGIVLSITLAANLALSPANADYQDKFPGRGSIQAWKQANSFYERGTKLLYGGKPADAIPELERAIQIYPNDESYYLNLGISLKRTAKFGAAEQAFKRALALQPKDKSSWNSLGSLYFSQKKFVDAESCYRKALALSPNDFIGLYNLTEVLVHQKKYSEAQRACVQAKACREALSYKTDLDGFMSEIAKNLRTSADSKGGM